MRRWRRSRRTRTTRTRTTRTRTRTTRTTRTRTGTQRRLTRATRTMSTTTTRWRRRRSRKTTSTRRRRTSRKWRRTMTTTLTSISLSYRSVGGGACFWTGGCQDHLVCFHLLAILTGQGDISKVLGSLNWPKKKFQIIWLHLLAGCWWLLQMKQAVMILWITWAVWEEPPTPLCQGPPRHFLIQPSNLKEEKPLCTWLVPLVDVDCTKVGFQLAPDVPTWSQPSRSLSLSTPCLWSPPLPPSSTQKNARILDAKIGKKVYI